MILQKAPLFDLVPLGATPEPEDFLLRLSPTVVPNVTLVDSFPNFVSAFNSSAVQRRSFIVDASFDIGASQPVVDHAVATFGVGLWEIVGTITHDQSFAPTLNGVNALQLRLTSPAGIATPIARILDTTANALVVIQVTYRFLLIQDGWILGLNTPATGVGQSQYSAFCGIANRLL